MGELLHGKSGIGTRDWLASCFRHVIGGLYDECQIAHSLDRSSGKSAYLYSEQLVGVAPIRHGQVCLALILNPIGE